MGSEIQFSTNLFIAHQLLLRERLHCLLSSFHPVIRADIVCALQDPGKLLSEKESIAIPAGTWSLITLLVAQCVSPNINQVYAGNVAVAVECLICSFDLLDDVEDDDQTPILKKIGAARALNTSTALLSLAQKSILSTVQYGCSFERIVHLLDILQEAIFVATSGQHLDFMAEQRSMDDMTIEDCIEIMARKAGSLMGLACSLGAICADADETLYSQFSSIGEAVGICYQLDNDCHDLYHLLYGNTSTKLAASAEAVTANLKTDLIRGKKTLPIVLAAKKDEKIWQYLSSSGKEVIDKYLYIFDEGIVSAQGICLLYRERALEILQKIEAQRPISQPLRHLLNLT